MRDLTIVVVNKTSKAIYYEAIDHNDAVKNTPNTSYTQAVLDIDTKELFEYKLVDGRYLSRPLR